MKQNPHDCNTCEHLAECKQDERVIQTGYVGYEHYIIAMCRHCPLDYYALVESSFHLASAVEKTISVLVSEGVSPGTMTLEEFMNRCKSTMTQTKEGRVGDG